MKRLFLIVLLGALCINAFAQTPPFNAKLAKQVKKAKLIVALQEYPKNASELEKNVIDSANTALRFAVSNYWNFSEVTDYMPISEAIKIYNKRKKTHRYILFDQSGSFPFEEFDKREVKKFPSDVIRINHSKAWVYFPESYHENYEGVTKVDVVFMVMQLQRMLQHMYDGDYISTKNSFNFYKNNGRNLKTKTLLIPKSYLAEDLNEEEIKKIYPYKFEICDNEKVEKAILDKNPEYAVIKSVPTPDMLFNKMYVEFQVYYVYNTEDGDIFGYALGGFKNSKGRTKYINIPTPTHTNRKFLTKNEIDQITEYALGDNK